MKFIFRLIYFVIIFGLTGCSPFKNYSVVNLMQEGLIWDNGTTTYDLGDVGIGSIKSKTFILTNKSNVRAINCDTPYLTNETDFTIDSTTCASEMEPFASCEVVITASPQSQGLKDVNIVRSCDLDSTRMNPVTAAKVNAVVTNISWTPTTTKNYGSVAIGDYAATTYNFTLTNAGTQSVTGCGTVTLSNSTDFEIDSNTCTNPILLPAETCVIGLRAKPMSGGLKRTSITRTCAGVGTVATQLSKIKVTGVAPVLAWSPLSEDFSDVGVGIFSSSKTFTLTNSSSVAGASGCSIPTLTNTIDFAITSTDCGTNNLSASSSCSVQVEARPTSLGLKTTTLSRACSLGGTVATTTDGIAVNGISVTPNLSISPNTMNFTSVNVGSTSNESTLTISNTGLAAATSCGTITLSNTTDFIVSADNCSSSTISPSGSCSVGIKATPQSSGVKNTTVSLSCSTGGTVSTTTNGIQVTGVSVTPNLSMNPSGGFGNVNVGSTSGELPLTITNTGAAAATGCGTVTLSNTTDFIVSADNCSSSMINASGMCSVGIKATPQSSGVKYTTVSLTCSTGGTVSTITNGIQATGVLVADWQSQFPMGDSNNINLGAVSLGKNSNTFDILFRNPNGENLTGCSLTQISNPTDFAIVSDTCATGTVSAANYCVVQIKSNPQSAVNVSTTMSRSCAETGNISQTLTATGTVAATAVQVSSYEYSSCVLLSDKTARCWGTNKYGGLGDGTAIGKTVPVLVSGLSNADYISVGNEYACALIHDGTVKCWGSNGVGQVGDGTTNDKNTPVQVSGLSNVVALGTGYGHACAVVSDGTVKCWGWNSQGQIGNGTPNTSANSFPVVVTGLSNVISVAAGSGHTCALINNGTVKCWGGNESGQLGNGTYNDSYTPVLVSGMSNVISISAANNYTCAVINNGTVKCWGNNYSGQLGDGTTVRKNTPVLVGGLSNVVSVSTGAVHTCALINDGTAKCWGSNLYYQLGDGTGTDRLTPVSMSGLANIVSISVSTQSTTCAVISDGTVNCIGLNQTGQLGDGTYQGKTVPRQILSLSNIGAVTAGSNYTCALINNGTIQCWGANSYGQLGDGTKNGSYLPVLVSGLTNVTSVSAGAFHACALINNGTVKCWGYNNFGQLGNGTATSSTTPVAVSGLSNVISITTGNIHTCALINDGTVKCWGYNGSGQLGNGVNTDSNVPVVVSGLSHAVSLSASNHTCALIDDGTLKCWGANYYGQLGSGTNTDSYVPVVVSGLSNVISVTTGNIHSCAVINDGTVKCWGYNGDGQLAKSMLTSSPNPIPSIVNGVSNVTSVSAGSTYTCALVNNGTIKCWGSNYEGALGDGTSVSRYTPQNVLINQASGVYASPEGSHTCAIKSSGVIYCWGQNFNSQTGFNENYIRNVSGF